MDIRKLQEYCLNFEHSRGRHKARVFAAVGILSASAEDLRTALIAAAMNTEAQPGATTIYGQRYTVDFDFARNDKIARIRSTWIVRIGEDYPRLTTCFVL